MQELMKVIKGRDPETHELRLRLVEYRDHVESFIRLLRKSKWVLRKLAAINIDPKLARAKLEEFAALLQEDKIGTISRLEVWKAIAEKKNVERLLMPEIYTFMEKELTRQTSGSLSTLRTFSDLRTPAEWFPNAREMKRSIHMHVGPTNSGKTYNALKRLEEAQTGVYAGPLRLLAHEVYERLNRSNHPCNLLTGEERKESDGVEKWAATVEMVPLGKQLDVAVIDEIQMIADEQRGWAWTQALLGLQAKEVHLCGEATAVELVRRILETTGETVEIHEYKRLTPLEVEKRGLGGSLTDIVAGDAIVTFSRNNIFSLRKKVEKATKMKAAVIYGNLPPETRAEQARLFNDQESEYKVLIASDAIGMGLNLNIRRVIFERLKKFDGKQEAPLSVSQIKQIAGRAGRFRTKFPTGYVTTLEDDDLMRVRQVMKMDSPPMLQSAGLYPQLAQIEAFAAELPNDSLSNLLDKFESLARLDGDYFLCNLQAQKRIAELIEPLSLTLRDRYTLVSAPANVDDANMASVMLKFARDLAEGNECFVRDVVTLPTSPPSSSESLRDLENMHKVLVLYLWLTYRFPSTFTEREITMLLKAQAEELINESLMLLHNLKQKRKDAASGSTADEDVFRQARSRRSRRPQTQDPMFDTETFSLPRVKRDDGVLPRSRFPTRRADAVEGKKEGEGKVERWREQDEEEGRMRSERTLREKAWVKEMKAIREEERRVARQQRKELLDKVEKESESSESSGWRY
ncbi:RNA helicase [Phlyctochytrium bullatum]|nr:RNA helicase [Phlyctochytrium bullatum]